MAVFNSIARAPLYTFRSQLQHQASTLGAVDTHRSIMRVSLLALKANYIIMSTVILA
jgi:hypothetical protein